MTLNPKFRAANGQYLTSGLFLETDKGAEGNKPLYTLKPYDHKGLPSLKRLYLEAEDPTEFDFACTYLEDYAHWERLCNTAYFRPHVEQWRKELALKLKSRALKAIIKDAVDGKYDANKFLVANGWIEKNEPGKAQRGRPSKSEVKEELARQAEIEKSLMDDMERLKGIN